MQYQQPALKEGQYVSKTRRKTAFALSLICLILVIVSFITPYWIQSWSRIHTPFDRLGMWEFCLDGYIVRNDPNMVSYFGCWWILAPYLYDIRVYLTPPWFITVQVLMTVVVIIQMVINILYIVYLCMYNSKKYERKATFCRFLLLGHIATGIFLMCTSIIFGVRCQERYWMPNPNLNWPSWSYGCAVLAAFCSLLDCPLLYCMWQEDRSKLDQAVRDFPMTSKAAGSDKGAASTLI